MFVAIALFSAGLLVFVSAAVQHFDTVTTRGLAFVFTERSAPLSRDGFPGRAARTLQNNLESAAMVGPPAVLLLAAPAAPGLLAEGAAAAYLAARVVFTLAYWSGRNRLRSLAWGTGMAMIAVLSASAVMVWIS